MFLVMNPPLKHRKGKKSKRTRSTRKNTGGKSRLAKLLAKFRARSAKRSSSFRGVALNRGGSARPLTCRLSSAPFKGINMKRRHGRGRHVRRNAGSVKSLTGSVMSGLNPKAWAEVVPYAGGAVVSELATAFAAKFIPMTAAGIGNILLSGAMAGITGTLTGALLKNSVVGTKMIYGGVAALIGKTIANVRTEGLHGAFGFKGLGYDDQWGNNGFTNHTFQGMNDFISVPGIANSIQSAGQIAQYALPNANAQYAPMVPQMQMAAGQTPMGHPSHPQQQMADYESGAVGAMIDQVDGSGY